MAGALSAALLASACGLNPRSLVADVTGPLPPPAPIDEAGGLHGAVIGGDEAPPPMTLALADAAIAPELRLRLQPTERQALAEASQYAATAKRGEKIAWPLPAPDAPPDKPALSAGWVAAVSDPYLSSHGLLCRDLRQALARGEGSAIEPVSLCREDASGGAHVWVAAHWP